MRLPHGLSISNYIPTCVKEKNSSAAFDVETVFRNRFVDTFLIHCKGILCSKSRTAFNLARIPSLSSSFSEFPHRGVPPHPSGQCYNPRQWMSRFNFLLTTFKQEDSQYLMQSSILMISSHGLHGSTGSCASRNHVIRRGADQYCNVKNERTARARFNRACLEAPCAAVLALQHRPRALHCRIFPLQSTPISYQHTARKYSNVIEMQVSAYR